MAYKIILACAGGLSTSMLVQSMKEAAKLQKMDVFIDAVAETTLDKYIDLDIIMLGPQVDHLQETLAQKYDIPVVTIDSMDYGMMDGAKVLADALAIIKK